LNERRHVAPEVEVRTLRATDREWLLALMEERWGGPEQVANGERFRPADLPGMVAEIDAARVGVVVLRIVGGRCEIGLIQSLREGVGVGTALMTAAIRQASASGCRAVVAVTTNDNVRARSFYERLGFSVREVRPGAVTESRKLKPTIALLGEDGTAITDEIEYEMSLEPEGGAT
jgi:ribosomal protein S18 acetylase RimI-like enzyme